MACCKCEEHGWNDPQPVVYTDPEDGNVYCLFHAPAEHKGVSVDAFNEQVSERIQAVIDLENEKALCDLSGAIFPGDICFASDSALPNISFEKARFAGGAVFDKVCFGKNAFFSEASFGGGTVFYKASFGEYVFFDKARFEGEALFNASSFMGNAYFGRVRFCGKVYFNETRFGRTISFNGASFDGNASFSEASFMGNTDFSSAQFNGQIRFNAIRNNNVILTFAYCIVSPSAMTFESCDPTCLDFVEQRDLTHIHFINASWEKNGRIKACTEDEPGRLQATRDFYQRMKAKYKAENNEYEASKWHVAEKEAQLKLLGEEGESRFLWAMLWLYKLVSGFGEDPRRAFWVLFGIFALPLLVIAGIEVYQHFSWWDFDSARLNHVFKQWLKFIPLTRAIGENEPGGWHALMLLWQLIITLQAALFAFALRNRFRR